MSRAAVVASAPGKLVLSGEYAVLAGAPALVAAVDRRVTCTVTPRCSGGWQFASTGFEAQAALSRAEVLSAAPTTLAGIARRVLPAEAMPAHLHVAVDSSPCFRAGVKLGVGSSAATVVALAAALAALGGDMPTLDVLYDIHAAFQGGGSGLDVAAATTGGVIRFQERRIAPARLPQGLHVVFVFCRTSSRTRELVARFNTWRTRRSAQPRALAELVDAAQEVADCTGNADSFVAALREYAQVLETHGPRRRHRRLRRGPPSRRADRRPLRRRLQAVRRRRRRHRIRGIGLRRRCRSVRERGRGRPA